MKSLIWVAALVTSALVAGCGGDGNAGTPPFGSGGGCDGAASSASSSCTVAEAIDVIASSVQVGSGGDTVTISAVVKDSGNVGLPGVGIVFNTNSGTLTERHGDDQRLGRRDRHVRGRRQPCQPHCNDHRHLGQGNRAALLSTSSAPRWPIQGHHRAAGQRSVTLSIKATDSKGAIVASLPITVASSLGNGLSATSLTTDTQGIATVDYTATNAGTDSLVFSGGGTSIDGHDPDQLVAVRVRVSGARYFDVPVNSTHARSPSSTRLPTSLRPARSSVSPPPPASSRRPRRQPTLRARPRW